MNFEFVLEQRAGCRTAGYKVRTSMANAGVDCAALWEQKFGPVIATFPADPAFPGESYGLSTDQDIDNGTFTYWATMPLAPGAAVPEGMETIDLPGGTYVACHHLALADISPAFDTMYGSWRPAQDKYDLDLTSPCFELYGCEYMESGLVSIYCRVLEK